MSRLLMALLLMAVTGHAFGQDRRVQDPPPAKKPITLPLFDPDLSPAAKEVEEIIQQGAREDIAGNPAAAVKVFELAGQKMRSIPELKGEEDSLLVRVRTRLRG